MSPRPYRLGRREAAVEETRDRVVEAARDVIAEAGFAQASLEDVAARAGVARATVYYQFGSKANLLEAAVEAVAAASRKGRLQRAREQDDPRAALLHYIEAKASAWEQNHDFYRNIAGLAVLDPDLARVAVRYEDRRREGLTWVVKRLDDGGALNTGVTHKRAVDVLWMLTSFRTYDHLRRYVGTSVADTVAILRALARTLLRDPEAAAN